MPVSFSPNISTYDETGEYSRPLIGRLATGVPIPRTPTELTGLKDTARFSQDRIFGGGSLLTPTASSSGPLTEADGTSDGRQPTIFEFAWDKVEVIFADDRPIYIDLVKARLEKQGVLGRSILTADDGLDAMEHLLASQSGAEDRPLLLLLDYRMPHMDGHECAARVREMADRGMLRRPPFMVGYSADIASMPKEREGAWPFDVLLSKEAFSYQNPACDVSPLAECFKAFEQWWAREPYGDSKRWRRFNLASTDCLIADDWPICLMSLSTALVRLGLLQSHVHEAEDGDEALEKAIELMDPKASLEGQHGGGSNPLLVILDQQMPHTTGSQCAAKIRAPESGSNQAECGQRRRREPFLACISAGDAATSFSAADKEVFHCFLPKAFTSDDLRWLLELFRLWWLERYGSVEGTSLAEQGDDLDKKHKGSAEELGAAMQAWRERREKRRVQRPRRQSYGDICRARPANQPLKNDELEAILQSQWPDEFLCPAADLLGRGSQADVYQARWRRPGSSQDSRVAVKVFRHSNANGAEDFFREIQIGKNFQSPHLAAIFASSPAVPPMLVQEFCAGGNLSEFLHNNGDKERSAGKAGTLEVPTTQQRLKIALDVACGMCCLHAATPPVIHRDLKSENVLLFTQVTDSTVVPFAKVADFGVARAVPESESGSDRYMTQAVGSLRYMAPEVMFGTSYDIRADMFSYAFLLYELLTSSVPYCEVPNLPKPIQEFLKEGGRPDTLASEVALERLAKAPSCVVEVMRAAWAQDPDARPSFADAVRELEHV